MNNNIYKLLFAERGYDEYHSRPNGEHKLLLKCFISTKFFLTAFIFTDSVKEATYALLLQSVVEVK